MHLGRIVLATVAVVVASAEGLAATTEKHDAAVTNPSLLFVNGGVSDHVKAKDDSDTNPSTEERHVGVISAAAAGARNNGGGTTIADDEPSPWEKFKSWWKRTFSDEVESATRRLRLSN